MFTAGAEEAEEIAYKLRFRGRQHARIPSADLIFWEGGCAREEGRHKKNVSVACDFCSRKATMFFSDQGRPGPLPRFGFASFGPTAQVTVTFRPRRPNSLFREKVLVPPPEGFGRWSAVHVERGWSAGGARSGLGGHPEPGRWKGEAGTVNRQSRFRKVE